MMIPRFPMPFPLNPGAQVELPDAAAHHAVRVLRMRTGDPLVLFDGRGGAWQAELKVGAGRTAQAVLKSFDDRECESPLAVTLVQALPSGDKMDWIVEKCVELGVDAIQPVTAHRSVVRLNAERMARRVQHWNQIAGAACAQSGRNRIPVVAPIIDLPQYLATAQVQNGSRLLLSPGGGVALKSLTAPSGAVSVMIGPEGGWEDGEILAARAAGFAVVRMGGRILRTETAGAAVLAAMQALWGDF